MNRTGLLSTIAMMLASSPSFAQFGGMGGMGGQGAAPGMMMRGGGRLGPGFAEVRRSVQVEMEGGQRLKGYMDLRPIIVDCDLGQYSIAPDKIKMIRFLKPANDADGIGDGEAGGSDATVVVPVRLQNRGASLRAIREVRGGFGGNADTDNQGAALTRGKVTTTTDQEIIGTIHVPADFRLILEFGALNLAPSKLRLITFTAPNRQEKQAPAEAAARPTPEVSQDVAENLPRYFRQGRSLLVISPVGDRVTLFDMETKESRSLELSGSKEVPLEIVPIAAENLVALTLKGSKIIRLAVADTATGVWHSQELRAPADGPVVPIIASGVVVYVLGQDVYAYGGLARRWDVTELAAGVRAEPIVGPETATIENNGHIYTFAGKSGKWEHVDIRAILGVGGKKK
jgi:hypothetical protein